MLLIRYELYDCLPTAVDNFRTVVVEIHPFPFAQSKRLLQTMLKTHNDKYGIADNAEFCCEYGLFEK